MNPNHAPVSDYLRGYLTAFGVILAVLAAYEGVTWLLAWLWQTLT